jgi:hypothetical protein
MENKNESEIRLAELIWRTVKLRVSLLTLVIVVLLVVWSSLLNGNQEAQKIDVKFCGYLVDNHNTLQQRLTAEVNKTLKPVQAKLPPVTFSAEDTCGSGSSRTWIEITRQTDEELPPEHLLDFSPDYIKQSEDEKTKAFADYDIQRHTAYRLQIQLSSEYSGSTIIVNALTVAKGIPFCTFLILAVVLILGFQQSAYRRRLRILLLSKSGDHLNESMAETQFFGAPLIRDSFSLETSSSTKLATFFLPQARRLLAACVLALSIYYLAFIAMLEYESVYWVPWLDKRGYYGTTSAKGYSLLYYDPKYGSWIFLGCCFVLIVLSFATETEVLASCIQTISRVVIHGWKVLFGADKSKGVSLGLV